MNRSLLATAAVAFALAGTPAVLAADMPIKAAPRPAALVSPWTGWYVGVNAGWAWGKTTATDIVASNGACWFGCFAQWSTDVDGFTGGVQGGWNLQVQNWVLGIEGDVGYLGVKGVGSYPLSTAGTTVVDTRGGLFATARGRAGVLVTPTALAYATGGAIFAWTRSNVHTITGAPVPISTNKADPTGWTVGGGVELRGAPNWSWKVEYLYYDLGNDQVGGICCGGGVIQYFKIDQTGHIVRLGVNWRL